MFVRDLLTALAVLAFSVAVIVISRGFTDEARFFPEFVAGALVILSLAMIVRTFLRRARGGGEAFTMFEAPGRVLGAVVFTGLYIMALPLVGFTLASFVFIPLSAWLFGYRRPEITIPVAAAYVAAVVGLFNSVLGLPLPPDVVLSRI